MGRYADERQADRVVDQPLHRCGRVPAHTHARSEAGQLSKALDACIKCREWARAVQLVESVGPVAAAPYYTPLAEHYAQVGEYTMAERFYVDGGMVRQAVQMYNRAGKYADAKRVSARRALSLSTRCTVGWRSCRRRWCRFIGHRIPGGGDRIGI